MWRKRQQRVNAAWIVGTVLFLVLATTWLAFFSELAK
jgi:hypothetical protein